MTKISHIFFFTPGGTSPDKTRKTFRIPCNSSHTNPQKSKSRAYRYLKNLVDNYAARNHWSVNHVVSWYENPPWKTSLRLKRDVENFSFVNKAKFNINDKDSYLKIYTDKSKGFLRQFLNRYYSNNFEYNLSDKGDFKALYIKWKTDI
jgi:hypothetical protein